LAAGDFGTWLAATEAVWRGEGDADVPCDGCTACCTSAQFVHIAPDETETLARIPRRLLFPAPGLPDGHVLLPYDEHGHCPMLIDARCSIYAHRPRTCRVYDCRVFAATEVEPDEDKVQIAARVRRWQFSHPGDDDERAHAAVRAAAAYLRAHPELRVTPAAAELAVSAIEAHAVFLDDDNPPPEAVRVTLRRSTGRA
jgi:Fe-S-cluster containining protein